MFPFLAAHSFALLQCEASWELKKLEADSARLPTHMIDDGGVFTNGERR